MPKKTVRRRRRQKRTLRGRSGTDGGQRPLGDEGGESESGGELGKEELEGLEPEDMRLISRMGLSDEVQSQEKGWRNLMSSDGLTEDSVTDDGGGERRKRRKRRREDGELEEGEGGGDGASWEGVRRRRGGAGEDEERVHYLLPLKTRGRLVLQPPVPDPNAAGADGTVSEEEEREERDNEMEVNEFDNSQPTKPQVERLSTAALLAKREAVLEQKKVAIADIASSLVESPEDSISGLQRLLGLCREREAQVACSVRKMAMASLTAVFKDIAPSYHIRELTEEEKATKVSKEVRKLRVFEESLLAGYQHYLTLLNDHIMAGLGCVAGGRREQGRKKKSKVPLEALEDGLTLSHSSMQDLGEVALRCMCELLVSLPHFNFRNNILTIIVPRMASKLLGGKICKLCCEAVERLFSEDLVGEVSLECVRLICKLVKSKSYNTRPAVLRSFLHLRLHSVDKPVGGREGERGGSKSQTQRGDKTLTGKGSQLTRKQRKRLKAERDLARDLREAEATESREKKAKLQTEVLQLVFAVYFRILKNSRHSPLLQPVLEGLAKFAHLISVDFFSDLMSVLHSLAETGSLTNKECMLCVLTAFEILSGQGEVLNIDPRQFYVQLYEALLQLDTVSSNEDVVLALSCMDKMMRKRRQVSLQRVMGFVKRLSTVSLQLMPGACLAMLSTIRKCLLAYSQCGQLLEVEDECGGVFRPDIPDPELSQAGSSMLWELSVYSRHYSPALREYATHLLHGAPTQGSRALNPSIAKLTAEEFVSGQTVALPSFPPPPPATALNHKGKEYYYRDTGIRDNRIRELEQEATQLAEEVTNFDLLRTS